MLDTAVEGDCMILGGVMDARHIFVLNIIFFIQVC